MDPSMLLLPPAPISQSLLTAHEGGGNALARLNSRAGIGKGGNLHAEVAAEDGGGAAQDEGDGGEDAIAHLHVSVAKPMRHIMPGMHMAAKWQPRPLLLKMLLRIPSHMCAQELLITASMVCRGSQDHQQQLRTSSWRVLPSSGVTMLSSEKMSTEKMTCSREKQ